MANRIIRESICTSPEIHQIDPVAEPYFLRLIVKCDDFGRLDARPPVLKGMLFPLRPEITENHLVKWMAEFENLGLIVRYEVDGLPYLRLKTWSKHQNVRTPRVKYPPDPNEESV